MAYVHRVVGPNEFLEFSKTDLCESLYSLHVASVKEDYPDHDVVRAGYGRDEFVREIADALGGGDWMLCIAIIVDTNRGEVIAMCNLAMDPLCNNTATISNVYVHPSHRNKGHCMSLLSGLLAHVEATPSTLPASTWVGIRAESDNVAACRCYEALFGPPREIIGNVRVFRRGSDENGIALTMPCPNSSFVTSM